MVWFFGPPCISKDLSIVKLKTSIWFVKMSLTGKPIKSVVLHVCVCRAVNVPHEGDCLPNVRQYELCRTQDEANNQIYTQNCIYTGFIVARNNQQVLSVCFTVIKNVQLMQTVTIQMYRMLDIVTVALTDSILLTTASSFSSSSSLSLLSLMGRYRNCHLSTLTLISHW